MTTPTQWNLADLFEAVADAVQDRTAVIVDDRRLTFREVDERATRLAHHLAAQGVKPGDHVGLYLYNGPEYVEGLFAAYKLRAVPINVNYRYVEAELAYLFDNADLAGLIHGREFVPRIAAVKDDCPKLVVFVAVEDGSSEDLSTIGATEYEAALAAASPERDFAARSEEDLYILYTGGTTGMPKGVMWTQKDFFLSTIGPLLELGGAKLDAPADVVNLAATGIPSVSFPIPPLMHGAALWVALMAMFGGSTLVLTSQRKMDPHAIWSTVEREKVMAITIVGDAMARPLIEVLDEPGASYDLSGLFVIGSGGAMLSPAVKEKIAEKLPNVYVSDSIGASETGYQGTFAGADDQGRPRFAMGEHTTVLDDDGMPVTPGDGVVGRLARGGYVPIGYYKDPEKTASVFAEAGGKRWVLPGRHGDGRGGRHDHAARPRFGEHQHRRREGLPRRGRERARRAMPTCSTSWSSGCPTSAGARESRPSSRLVPVRRRPSTISRPTPVSTSRATRCRARCTSSTRSCAPRPARPTTAGQRSRHRQVAHPLWRHLPTNTWVTDAKTRDWRVRRCGLSPRARRRAS